MLSKGVAEQQLVLPINAKQHNKALLLTGEMCGPGS